MTFGIGLRSKHYQEIIETRPSVDFFEVISENFMASGGRPRAILRKLRQDYAFALHGVSLNIGSDADFFPDYLQSLKALVDETDPMIVSDHLCWTGRGGRNWHDLLPLQRTKITLQHIVERVDKVQTFLKRQISLENISTYLEFKVSDFSEVDFLVEVARQSGCGILLDVNNIFVNSVNHGFDAFSYIDAIPKKFVTQYHLAGHEDRGDFLFDTHDSSITPKVWNLFSYAQKKIGHKPSLIERDEKIPELKILLEELEQARTLSNLKEDEMVNAQAL